MVFSALFALLGPNAARAEIAFTDSSVPVQEGPVGIIASHCNVDGLPDLVVANQLSNNVTILRNRGDGTLVFSTTFPAAAAPGPVATPTPTVTSTAAATPTQSSGSTATPTKTHAPTPVPTATFNGAAVVSSATCGDFNGDGLGDVAYVVKGSNTVTIRRKEADGTFTLLSTLAVGALPNWISSADMNQDGNVDLVVVDSQSSDVTILLGDGTGAFPFTATARLISDPKNRPVSAAIADFDNDHNMDILVGSQGVPSLRLLRGTGVGFVESTAALPSPPHVKSIATGDLNGDTIPDLAVLSNDNTIRFYLGDGKGSFTPFGTFPVGQNTNNIALGDFDGDGLVDLALDYYKTNDVQVLFATGPAQFTPSARFGAANQDFASSAIFNPPNAAATRATADGAQLVTFDKTTPAIDLLDFSGPAMAISPLTPLPTQPQTILLADFNNDGIPDAVVAAKGHHGIALQILPGDAAGAYGPAPSGPSTCGNGVLEGSELCDDGNTKSHDGCSATCAPEIGNRLVNIAAADMNRDGNEDLVLVGANKSVQLLLGDGQGRFTAVRQLAKTLSGTPIAVADFTGDGVPDILTVPFSSRVHGLSLLQNDGAGNFTTASLVPTLRLTGPFVTGDFDGDGLLDLLAGSKAQGGGAVMLYNDGTGPNAEPANVPAGKGITGLAVADFNEDGILDVLSASNSSTHPFTLLPGQGDGQYGAGQAVLPGTKGSVPTVFDANQDVHQDVVLCNPASSPPCQVQFGDGKGNFSATPTDSATFVGRDLRAVGAADFDGDGVTDFVGVSRHDDTAVVLFRAGASTPAASVVLATGSKPRAVAVDDLNGDSLPDIVVANGGSDDLSIFINQGGRQFQALTRVRLPKDAQGNPGKNPSALAIVDLDNDGKRDIVVSEEDSSSVARLINSGGGGFASAAVLATGHDPVDVAVGDLNNDNVPDFVTANGTSGTLTVLLSAGGSYTATTLSSGGVQASAVALTDLEPDGDLDIVAINQGSNSIATFLNDGNGAFTLKKVGPTRGRHGPQDLCVGDFDNDGVPDVAIASPGTKDILVLRGTGDGLWAADERTYQVGKDPISVVCVKVDHDVTPDIVFGRRGAGDINFIKTGG